LSDLTFSTLGLVLALAGSLAEACLTGAGEAVVVQLTEAVIGFSMADAAQASISLGVRAKTVSNSLAWVPQ